MTKLSGAWELARESVGKAQTKQKTVYDRHSRPPNFVVGDRVFLFQPAEKTGEARKLARPYHGPYRIVELDTNTAHVRRVDRPQDDTILVALGRLRRCAEEISDEGWPPLKERRQRPAKKANPEVPAKQPMETTTTSTDLVTSPEEEPQPKGKWAGRLRGHKNKSSVVV